MDKQTEQKWLTGFFILLAIILVAGAGILAWDFMRAPAPIPAAKPIHVAAAPIHTEVLAPPASEVEKTAQVQKPIQAKTVTVYAPAAKKALRLPDTVQQDDQEQVIASTTAEPEEHAVTTTTVLNLATGQSTTYQMQEPLPWLQLEHHGEAGVTVGLVNGLPAARAELVQDFAQVKAVHLAGDVAATVPLAGNAAPRDFTVGLKVYTRW